MGCSPALLRSLIVEEFVRTEKNPPAPFGWMLFAMHAPTLCCALMFPIVPTAIRSPAVRACDATESSTAASLNEPVLILPSGGVYAAAEVARLCRTGRGEERLGGVQRVPDERRLQHARVRVALLN